MAPEGEVCFDPFLERGQVKLLEPGDLLLRRTSRRRSRRAAGRARGRAPHGGASTPRAPRPPASAARACREQRREAVRVELSVLDPEDVPGRPGQEDARSAAAGPTWGSATRLRAPCEAVRRTPGRSSEPLQAPARPRARRSGDRSRPPRLRATEAQPGECVAFPSRAPACGPAARSPADRGRETPSTPRFELGPEPNTNGLPTSRRRKASTRSLPALHRRSTSAADPPQRPITSSAGRKVEQDDAGRARHHEVGRRESS